MARRRPLRSRHHPAANDRTLRPALLASAGKHVLSEWRSSATAIVANARTASSHTDERMNPQGRFTKPLAFRCRRREVWGRASPNRNQLSLWDVTGSRCRRMRRRSMTRIECGNSSSPNRRYGTPGFRVRRYLSMPAAEGSRGRRSCWFQPRRRPPWSRPRHGGEALAVTELLSLT